MKTLVATILLAIAPLAHAGGADGRLAQADDHLRRGEFRHARAIFSAMAAAGNAEAMHQLGIDHAKGLGGSRRRPDQGDRLVPPLRNAR